jgi:hypothetical protein
MPVFAMRKQSRARLHHQAASATVRFGHQPAPDCRVDRAVFPVYQESAQRAIINASRIHLPAAYFDEWKCWRTGIRLKHFRHVQSGDIFQNEVWISMRS